mgnify:FL=1
MPTDKHGHVMGVHDRCKALDRTMELAKIRGYVRFHDLRPTASTRLNDEALRNRLRFVPAPHLPLDSPDHKTKNPLNLQRVSSRGEWIRTTDSLTPSQVR